MQGNPASVAKALEAHMCRLERQVAAKQASLTKQNDDYDALLHECHAEEARLKVAQAQLKPIRAALSKLLEQDSGLAHAVSSFLLERDGQVAVNHAILAIRPLLGIESKQSGHEWTSQEE
mmetsp:Transcript_7795/g.22133  ORF Transcript_7795/g.22133 Transcript_7795/m.22133 type:complete len:120 (+) Transcript_7795:129-488(+)